jgi:hypothetical protein
VRAGVARLPRPSPGKMVGSCSHFSHPAFSRPAAIPARVTNMHPQPLIPSAGTRGARARPVVFAVAIAALFLATLPTASVRALGPCPPPPYPNALGPLSPPCGPWVLPQTTVPCVPGLPNAPPAPTLATHTWTQPAVNGDSNSCGAAEITGSYEAPCPVSNKVPVLSTPYNADYCGAVPTCLPFFPVIGTVCLSGPVQVAGVPPGYTVTCAAKVEAPNPPAFRSIVAGLDYDFDGTLDATVSPIDRTVVSVGAGGIVTQWEVKITNLQPTWARVISWVNDDFTNNFPPGSFGLVDINCW